VRSIAKVNGFDIFYEITGKGTPIIWCHEAAGDYRAWDPQVRFFSRYFQNITWNFRGFPPSAVPNDPATYSEQIMVSDMRELLRQLKVDRAHVVGLASGAAIALTFALTHPEMCLSLTLAACGVGSLNTEQRQQQIEKSVEMLSGGTMDVLVEFQSRRPARQQFLRKDPKGWQLFHDQFLEQSPLGWSMTARYVAGSRPTVFSLKEKLNALRVPTLIMVGDEDEACLEPSIFIKRQLPSAGLVTFPQSGHTLNLEDPAAFNDALLKFLQHVAAGTWATTNQPRQ
jgi:pimeloyl-ACP methyl ester carboxylesterase